MTGETIAQLTARLSGRPDTGHRSRTRRDGDGRWIGPAATFMERAAQETAHEGGARDYILGTLARDFTLLHAMREWTMQTALEEAPPGVPAHIADLAVHSPFTTADDAWASYTMLSLLDGADLGDDFDPEDETVQQWLSDAADQAYNLYILAHGRQLAISSVEGWEAVSFLASARSDIDVADHLR
ncbi:hypothetical protein ACFC1T_09240 [Kitasatospora sp. NPDC056076]|uniref:hypothetical protein n=1 Tax=Kitasatospora sp. NPDC056076 TaxID=3345703 RepID=UPI0035D80152